MSSGLRGGVVVRVRGSNPDWGRSLHVLSVYAGVLSRYSGFLPPPKNRGLNSKLSLGVGVCVDGCVSRLSPHVWDLRGSVSDSKLTLGVSMSRCDGLATCPGRTHPFMILIFT